MNEWCPEWDPGLAPSAELAELAQLLPWNRRLQADYTRPRRWRSGNGCPLPQRGSACEPRMQTWGPVCKMRSILKERRITPAWGGEDQSSMVVARRNAKRSGMPPAAREATANTSPVSPARTLSCSSPRHPHGLPNASSSTEPRM